MTDTRARVREAAEGNPLFVEQLLAIAAEGGELERIPPTIQALLAARLDALPETEREVLERASVIGLEFEWEALGELAPDRRRPSGTQLAALVRKELIRPHEAIEDTFRFRHMLIRDAAYERVPKERRSDLHERFAAWLDGRGVEFDEIVGYHLEQAHRCLVELGRPGDRAQALADRAAGRLGASSERAYSRGDTHAAASLLDRAVDLLSPDDRRRPHLLTLLGRVLAEAGEFDRANAVLSDAVESGWAAGERGVAADAGVTRSFLRNYRGMVGQEEVMRAVDDAIPVFEELGDTAALASALGVAGTLRFWRGEVQAAAEDLERAASYARDAGDRAQEALSLQFVLLALVFGPTPVDRALKRVEEIRSRTKTNRRLEVDLLRTRGHLEAMRGRFDAARDLIAQAAALGQELGLESVLVGGLPIQACDVELLAGDAIAAERAVRPACETLERAGGLGSIGPLLVDALFLQGRDDEALRLSDRWTPERITVPDDADGQISWRRVRAKLLARRGEVEEAERLAREAVSIAARTDFLLLHAQAFADLATVFRLAGRPEESAAAAREAIRLYEEKGNIAAAAAVAATMSVSAPR